MDHRLPLLLLLAPLSAACIGELDNGADRGSPPKILPIALGQAPDPGDGATPTLLETPAIQVVTDLGAGVIEGSNTMNPCDATGAQALFILQTYCGACHGSKLQTGQGVPPWNYVDVPSKMLDPAHTTDIAGVPFLAKASPKGSRIYQRIILGNQKGAMPPVYDDPTLPVYPRPNVSDYSVLNEWIKSCL